MLPSRNSPAATVGGDPSGRDRKESHHGCRTCHGDQLHLDEELRGCDPAGCRPRDEDAPERQGCLDQGAAGRHRWRFDRPVPGQSYGDLRPRRLSWLEGALPSSVDEGFPISNGPEWPYTRRLR